LPSIFKSFFHKKSGPDNPQSQAVDSATPPPSSKDLLSEGLSSGPAPSQSSTLTHLDTHQILVGIAQSVGIQRDTNEDSLFTLTSNLIYNDGLINFGLYILADGMGGHDHGEVASSIAVTQLASYVVNTFYNTLISSEKIQTDRSIQELLRDGVLTAHQAIRQAASGSGTTLTAGLVLGDHLTIVHVGDSRAYSIDPDGQMHLLTHDHSLVKRLEDIGQLSPDEASIHPKRNLLYRALGQGDQLEPDITSQSIFKGQSLLICSDGLWGVVSDRDISALILSSTEPQVACQLLMDAANAAGGPDNISAILIKLPV
jgi:PPM family protein phosphatase